MKNIFFLSLSILVTVHSLGQSTVAANNSNNNHFLGWNSAPFDLNIRHNQNYGINWFTNNTRRMRMFPSQNVTINQGQFTTNTEGRLMLSSQSFLFNTVKPLSLLHLVGDDGWLEFTYRPWIDDGLSLTANGDAMWMGLKDTSKSI